MCRTPEEACSQGSGGPSSGAPMTSYSSMTGKVLIVCACSSVPSWSGLTVGPCPPQHHLVPENVTLFGLLQM